MQPVDLKRLAGFYFYKLGEKQMEVEPLDITLEIGYTDRQGKVHKDVTFGHRLTGLDLFYIGDDPRAKLATTYSDMILAKAITKFGEAKMPVTQLWLLHLDAIDRDDLSAAYNLFSASGLGGRVAESLSDDTVKLAFGHEVNGAVYDVVTFGVRLTGLHELEADKLELEGVKRLCYLAGQQVVRLSQSEGAGRIEGALDLEVFKQFDMVDIFALEAAARRWRESFRKSRKKIQEDDSLHGGDSIQRISLERI
jgi:hypothetical protein